jgi:hypothetical protein
VPQNDGVVTFEAVVEALGGRDRVAVGGGRGFGGNALQVDGRIFAMSNDRGLVLKLPRSRVADLIASGDGLPFDAGKGRPMAEWVVIPPNADVDTIALAEDALVFVGSRSAPGRPTRSRRRGP